MAYLFFIYTLFLPNNPISINIYVLNLNLVIF
nr:hypothetical protein CJLB15_00015 [Campylobacter phage CJLB-15]